MRETQKNSRSKRTRIVKEPEERRQEIIETALELFSEKGYTDTAMQDISEKMNVSPGLCYRYFKSKVELFAATSEYYAQQAVEQIKLPVSSNLSALEKFNLVLKRIFEYTIKHHDYEASYKEDEAIRASRLDNVAENMVDVLIPIIEQGVSDGTFVCSNVEYTTRLFTYGIIHTIHSTMPSQNTKEYFVSYLDFLKDMFTKSLEIKTPNDLGNSWQDLYK
ncbi:TetR family transcriptional regulator [Ruminiclostridium sufflavum DSM 19573]|uniref:TetR family transcriptional regulator n=1 Tax=Ruminiclostridium sufflavum DSM 19573 TaxID=1121337 RepID=A0A318XKU5_9FIRM|nr:TetR/AcrR family transcriptional regulator [Ruminiclostridium sufflavum]PYG85714.1 TetR family transcriptional regulator [Ruminiclostridium sufflavum DSM 19573]